MNSAYSFPLAEPRRQETFWVISYNGRPAQHLGFECQEGFWWFPTAGFSTNQIFLDEESAMRQALVESRIRVEREISLQAFLQREGVK